MAKAPIIMYKIGPGGVQFKVGNCFLILFPEPNETGGALFGRQNNPPIFLWLVYNNISEKFKSHRKFANFQKSGHKSG